METPDPPASLARAVPEFDLHNAIRRRAEKIYFESGGISGRDLENWAQAEREVRSRQGQTKRRTAVVVKVHDVEYVGEYGPDSPEGYAPGEFAPGQSVAVVIEGDRMMVRRPNGRVLETRIVHTIG